MSRTVGPYSQHGVATYNTGLCKCASCRRAKREKGRRIRNAQRVRDADETWYPCDICGVPFPTHRGMVYHRSKIHW